MNDLNDLMQFNLNFSQIYTALVYELNILQFNESKLLVLTDFLSVENNHFQKKKMNGQSLRAKISCKFIFFQNQNKFPLLQMFH